MRVYLYAFGIVLAMALFQLALNAMVR